MSKEIDTKQMSLLEDSHVNHSQLPVKEKEQMTTDTSGMKLLESLENVKPKWFIGENVEGLVNIQEGMVLRQVQTDLEKKVSKSNVLLFQLQASVLGIKEKESGLSDAMYPTPTQDSASERTKKYKQGGTPLTLAVQRMYPTPTTMDHIDRKGMRPSRAATNRKSGLFIGNDKKMLPTPNAWDGKRGPRSQKNLIEKQHQINLITAIKDSQSKNPVHQWMYKTPMARDHKDINFNNTLETREQSTINNGKRSSERQQTWWQTQSDLCGVPNGISYELDKDRANRVKALGNSIVPQIARELGLAILDAEKLIFMEIFVLVADAIKKQMLLKDQKTIVHHVILFVLLAKLLKATKKEKTN